MAETRSAKVAPIRPTGRLRFADGARPGFKGFLRQTGARALTTFYRRMLFMSYQLDGPEIPVYNASVSVEYAELESSDLDAYVRFRPDSDIGELQSRLALDHRCFVCWHDDEIVDCCWAATSDVRVPYMRRYLRLNRGDVYSFDSYTDPRFRGHGVYMARNSFQARLNRAEGMKRSVALVAYENYAAWLILSRSGLKTLGTYHYVRVPGKGLCWNTSLPSQDLPELSPNPATIVASTRGIAEASKA